jgi:MFS family permease
MIFGLVATLQAFVHDRSGFLASRLFLGLAEAGYIPGAVYTLSTWYSKKELAKRVAILFFGMFGGNALSPILASGILKLDGQRGIRGWQWLFLCKSPTPVNSRQVRLKPDRSIVEGIFTMSVGILLLLVLPGSPDNPKPLLTSGLVRFSEADQDILQRRLEIDDEERKNGAQGMKIPLKLVWKTVSHYRRWPHFVSTFAVFSTWSPLTTYTPSIIM